MALYAIGDLHLGLSVNKPMDKFGSRWEHHTQKLKDGFSALTDEDVCIICGDLSWGMNFQECAEDFKLIDSLPGKKIISKGNHDYWWTTASKIHAFFEEHGITSIEILHNNAFAYQDISICGTRGWFFEEETGSAHDEKIMNREITRLKASLEAAPTDKKIVFLHYPPIYQNYECKGILELLREHQVRLCCYGHIHGKGIPYAFQGWRNGTEFRLVSADAVNFCPVKLFD